MIVTLDRIDAWFMRGFEGASHLVSDRASESQPLSFYHMSILKTLIKTLEQVLYNPNKNVFDRDALLFNILTDLTHIVSVRGTVPDREKLKLDLARFQRALEKFEEQVK